MGHPSVEPKAHVGEELEALPRTNRRDAAGKKSLEGAILLSKKTAVRTAVRTAEIEEMH